MSLLNDLVNQKLNLLYMKPTQPSKQTNIQLWFSKQKKLKLHIMKTHNT